jgi:hypothetical protein
MKNNSNYQNENTNARQFNYECGSAIGYFTKSDYIKPGIYKNPEGYTPNVWTGSNCPKDRFLPVKEVSGYIREYIKKDPELRACKWSVTTESYSGGQSLTVALMAAPFDVFSEEWKEKHPYDVEHGYTQHGDHEEAVTPEAFRVISKVKAFTQSFNYDDSDGMIDYFDRGFYDSYHIGKWDKPFVRIEPKPAKPAAKTNTKTEAEPVTVEGLQLVDYSEKAIAVIGNTKPISEQLKKIGGRFNSRLSCGAGWIFSKRKESELRTLLAL